MEERCCVDAKRASEGRSAVVVAFVVVHVVRDARRG